MAQESGPLHRIAEPVASDPSHRAQGKPLRVRSGQEVRKIRGKIKNVGAPTFLRGGTLPRFCVSRGNKRHTRLMFVCRGNKGDSPPPLKLRRASPSSRKGEAGDDHAGVFPPCFVGEGASVGKVGGMLVARKLKVCQASQN